MSKKLQVNMVTFNSMCLVFHAETESCFERLSLVDGTSDYLINQNSGPGSRLIQVKLPKDKKCDRCILRWHWKSANNWGQCADGSHQVGCGPQETYRNCADIAVNHEGGVRGPNDNSINSNDVRYRLAAATASATSN